VLRREPLFQLNSGHPPPAARPYHVEVPAALRGRRDSAIPFVGEVGGNRVPGKERATREALDRFELQVRRELGPLDDILAALRGQPGLEVFPLNERMLERAVVLSELDLSLKPFDQAILAAVLVLVRAEELRGAGDSELCFCETDAVLQPWDKRGDAKRPLTDLYDAAQAWVYGDLEFTGV
jgi:hypothetical protein